MGLDCEHTEISAKKKIKNPTIGERRRWGQSGVKKPEREMGGDRITKKQKKNFFFLKTHKSHYRTL